MTNFGAFVELDEGIEGLIHVSEFDDSRHAGKSDEKIELKVGENYQMKIIKLCAGGAEDRPVDSRAQVGRVPRRLGGVPGRRRRRQRDAGRSLRESIGCGSGFRASAASRGPRPGACEGIHMTGGSMTKAELVEEVSRVSDLTKKHSEVIVDTVFKSIIDALHRGEKIELRGFGSFRLRKREPRKGRNPKTGDKVDVPPKKVPYFKPGQGAEGARSTRSRRRSRRSGRNDRAARRLAV